MPKAKATFGSEVELCPKMCLSNNLHTTEANLMKVHRKVKHNEKVSCTQVRYPLSKSRPQSGVRGQVIFLQ